MKLQGNDKYIISSIIILQKSKFQNLEHIIHELVEIEKNLMLRVRPEREQGIFGTRNLCKMYWNWNHQQAETSSFEALSLQFCEPLFRETKL